MSPIGVFDSGVGGLTVVAALRRVLPGESILYLGDTARLPYGTKSPETVLRYTRRNVDFLLERGVKAIVIACNTASALALPDLDLGVPTLGVIEPGARRAVAASAGRIGVIATESTIRSDAYADAISNISATTEVISHAAPLFVPLVEEGWDRDPVSLIVAKRYLEPLIAARIDTLVLGCTHYPVLIPLLAEILGAGIEMIDSGAAVAEDLATLLRDEELLSARPEPEHHFCVTDAGGRFARIARRVLGDDRISLELVEIL